MATSPKKETPDSGVTQNKPTAAAAQHGDHDRIVMASRRADGSMDQVNPEFIGDKETAIAAAKEQLAVQAVSAVDVAARGVAAGPADDGTGSSEPDADIKALKEEQEKAKEAAESQAEREVEQRHQGLGA
ncbi:hypothetical protein [Streptomyces sp. AVP053U2]|uniref:hypothetical protein n=1 Tax=Streptomyces sp. AVP053U2 TaxID=1737066 RepID=UPI00073CEA49|nr:hypothetical protein [Streptomyces sp. AVP053U2]ODA69518.1 hypothetical protein APS67_006322 [Streptomyces sp. AVP053U2]